MLNKKVIFSAYSLLCFAMAQAQSAGVVMESVGKDVGNAALWVGALMLIFALVVCIGSIAYGITKATLSKELSSETVLQILVPFLVVTIGFTLMQKIPLVDKVIAGVMGKLAGMLQ